MKENNSIFEKVDNSVMTTIEILLHDNSNIVLSFREHEKNLAFQVYNLMLPRVQNLTYNPQQDNVNMNSQYPPNYQQNSNYNTQYPNNYQAQPTRHKSVLIALILHILVSGLGYAYLGKWGKFIIIFVLILICGCLWFLIIPLIALVIIWLYALIDTIQLVEKYNNGEPI